MAMGMGTMQKVNTKDQYEINGTGRHGIYFNQNNMQIVFYV